jgi:hypothetical protein
LGFRVAVHVGSSLNVTIGSRPDGSNLVDGKIDEVRIYNRPLTATELQQL